MSVYKYINNLKIEALTNTICKMSSFGDIQLYNHKSDIVYPYINFDVVTSRTINNGLKIYTIRVYIMDRNEPYISYSKCEDILDNFMKSLDITKYTTNYFSLDFLDQVSGVFVDVDFEDIINLNCIPYDGNGYVILENGDFLNKYLLLEEGQKMSLDN